MDDLVIAGVSASQTRAGFDGFVRKFELDWPQNFDGGWKSAAMRDHEVRALPFHVLVDGDGKVAARSVTGAGLEELIRGMLPSEL